MAATFFVKTVLVASFTVLLLGALIIIHMLLKTIIQYTKDCAVELEGLKQDFKGKGPRVKAKSSIKARPKRPASIKSKRRK